MTSFFSPSQAEGQRSISSWERETVTSGGKGKVKRECVRAPQNIFSPIFFHFYSSLGVSFNSLNIIATLCRHLTSLFSLHASHFHFNSWYVITILCSHAETRCQWWPRFFSPADILRALPGRKWLRQLWSSEANLHGMCSLGRHVIFSD